MDLAHRPSGPGTIDQPGDRPGELGTLSQPPKGIAPSQRARMPTIATTIRAVPTVSALWRLAGCARPVARIRGLPPATIVDVAWEPERSCLYSGIDLGKPVWNER
jgi:hypothetical protein